MVQSSKWNIVIGILMVLIVLGAAWCFIVGLQINAGKLKPSQQQEIQKEQSEEEREESITRELKIGDFTIKKDGSIQQSEKSETKPEDMDRDYLCGYSSERLMDEEDISALEAVSYDDLPTGKTILRMIINEMYARYGYQFMNQEIQEYFEQKEWYRNITQRNGDMEDIYRNMTQIEKSNIAFITEHEEE